MASNELKFWELVTGGFDGGTLMDASVSTAAATGLAFHLIDVRIATQFATLNGWDLNTATGIDFIVDNAWSPEIAVGYLFAGKGRYFTEVTLTGSTGQILRVTKSDS